MVRAEDAINNLFQVVGRIGAFRVMFICAPPVLAKSIAICRVGESIGGSYTGLFSGAMPDSLVHTLDWAMELVGDLKPDVLVSAGGRSTPDMSKGIFTLLGEGGSIQEHQVIFEAPDKPIRPSLPGDQVLNIVVSAIWDQLN